MPTDAKRIAALLSLVSRANIERDVKHLSTAYPTRHTFSRHLPIVANWLAERLQQIRASNVRFHVYRKNGKSLCNVIGELPGQTAKTILVSAHFDSRQERINDPEAPAPGANDNATGVAVALEAARICAALRLRDSVRFVFFSGEEQGLWGSQAYALEVMAEKLDLKFVFNLDQLGFPPKDRAIYVDRDEGNKPENNAASAALVARIQKIAREIVRVPTRVDPAFGSDYLPFEALGYTIVGLYEAGKDYPQYHTSQDTWDRVDFAYVQDMARLTLATLLSEGGLLRK